MCVYKRVQGLACTVACGCLGTAGCCRRGVAARVLCATAMLLPCCWKQHWRHGQTKPELSQVYRTATSLRQAGHHQLDPTATSTAHFPPTNTLPSYSNHQAEAIQGVQRPKNPAFCISPKTLWPVNRDRRSRDGGKRPCSGGTCPVDRHQENQYKMASMMLRSSNLVCPPPPPLLAACPQRGPAHASCCPCVQAAKAGCRPSTAGRSRVVLCRAEEQKAIAKVDRSKDQLYFTSEASLQYLDGSLPG